MFCKQCGGQLAPNAIICPKCGAAVTQNNAGAAKPADSGGCLWLFIGFLLGWISLILYFVWRHEYPIRAKTVLIGWIIEMVIGLFIAVVVLVIIIVLFATGVLPPDNVLQPLVMLLPM